MVPNKPAASWGGKTWGAWHTGPASGVACPQDGRRHTVDEAARLNEKEAEYRQGVLYASMRRWRES
jgi:hypothetical protein